MTFSYDKQKSDFNLRKHGIDFEEIQELWYEPMLELPVRSKGEQRTLGIGRLAGEYWTVIYKSSPGNIRIISARRSTRIERSSYDRFING